MLQNNHILNTLHFPLQNVKQRIPNYEIGDPAYRYFQIALKNMSLVQMMQKLFLITC